MARISPEEWKKGLASDPTAAQRVHGLLLQVATTNHVMSKVVIKG
jgi:hypothetical protein